jgi:predicted HTH transcriptional regulator
MFDIAKIKEYREGNRFEVKTAQGGFPDNMWPTYSAFANTDGGVILLGARENNDGSLNVSGVSNADSIIKAFWDTVNNRSKVNVNILRGGISDPRNSALFLMFSLIGIGERAGSGLTSIETTWREENLPEPVLSEQFNPDRTVFTLPINGMFENKNVSVNDNSNVSVSQCTYEPVDVNVSVNKGVSVRYNENVSVKLTETESVLLELLQRNGKLTSIKLSELTGKDPRTIARGLKKLKENKLIERIGSDKTGEWKVIR